MHIPNNIVCKDNIYFFNLQTIHGKKDLFTIIYILSF